MQKKINVGAVNYLNTKPLIYGFEHGFLADQINLILDYPSNLSKFLQTGQLDIALLPVASMQEIDQPMVISNYCIATDREVASVCLFSKVPIEEVRSVYLDYQSKTSIRLCQVLLRDHWKIKPELLTADVSYIDKIDGTTAGVIIGDRALKYYDHFSFRYDLGSAWYEYTGMPFVFAAWVSNKILPVDFIEGFNLANRYGLRYIDDIASRYLIDEYDIRKYFTYNIKYELTREKREAMDYFLDLIKDLD